MGISEVRKREDLREEVYNRAKFWTEKEGIGYRTQAEGRDPFV